MNENTGLIIEEYLRFQENVFTADDIHSYVKSRGGRISREALMECVRTSDFVFPLVNDEYVTRAGVFSGRLFSFMPSKEEIEKGHIMIGHRCMPFINPEVTPDRIQVTSGNRTVKSSITEFSMNLALDVFALFGEGYVIPSILGDRANKKYKLSSLEYSLPSELYMTSWSLDKICRRHEITFGDRILCKVIDWNDGIVDMSLLKVQKGTDVLSREAIEREEWYDCFEEGLLRLFDAYGPLGSIEEQLAYLYLENQTVLCRRNCGSSEEFLRHTKRIGFSHYGVESRIWRVGEEIPFVGEWNSGVSEAKILHETTLIFSPAIIDAYLEDFISTNPDGTADELDELLNRMFPPVMKLTSAERKFVLLNMEKRHAIMKKHYNKFSDFPVTEIRHRMVEVFSQVTQLLCSIVCSGVKLDAFPQQELIVLVQLFEHLARMLEEVENVYARDFFPLEDITLSFTGMTDTFYDIEGTLRDSLEYNTYHNFEIIE